MALTRCEGRGVSVQGHSGFAHRKERPTVAALKPLRDLCVVERQQRPGDARERIARSRGREARRGRCDRESVLSRRGNPRRVPLEDHRRTGALGEGLGRLAW